MAIQIVEGTPQVEGLNLSPDETLFVSRLFELKAALPAEKNFGNETLRDSLGWTENKYNEVRQLLLGKDHIEKASGKGAGQMTRSPRSWIMLLRPARARPRGGLDFARSGAVLALGMC
jgi:hypothetical protein